MIKHGSITRSTGKNYLLVTQEKNDLKDLAVSSFLTDIVSGSFVFPYSEHYIIVEDILPRRML